MAPLRSLTSRAHDTLAGGALAAWILAWAGVTAHSAADLTLRSRDGLTLTLAAEGGAVTGVGLDGSALPAGTTGAAGFRIEDIGRQTPERPAGGTCTPVDGGIAFAAELSDAALRVAATLVSRPTHVEVTGELLDTSGEDRAILLTFALPLDAAGWTWSDDIRGARAVQPGQSYANTQPHGEGGRHSLYPFSCLHNEQASLCWGIPLDRPIICRTSYNGPRQRYEIAFDLGLSQATAKFPGRAAFCFVLYRSDPAWGFRAAARRFYDLYANSFTCRPQTQGIWMPFTKISSIEDFEDFGFGFQEGAPEVAFDDRIGVYDFVYVEPWSLRLYLPPTTKGTPKPEEILADPAVAAKQPGEIARAKACATTTRTGALNTRSYLASWAAGSKVYDFTALPDPDLPGDTKAAAMDKLIGERFAKETGQGAVLDGVYFDGFGEWVGDLNYRKELWATADYPLAFSHETHQPVQVYAFGVYEDVAHMSRVRHPQGKMLMANGYLYGGYPFTAHWLDVGGNEIHWTRQRGDHPFFDYRRTLAYRRPYLPLNNEDFGTFKGERVEEYLQKCLFWGFFPSMFSPGASSFGNFWQTPDYHNRERSLFRAYIPLIRRVSEAGWEPVTQARASLPALMVERFGGGDRLHLTCHNPGRQEAAFELAIDAGRLAIPATATLAADLVSGRQAALARDGATVRFSWTLAGESTAAFWITSPESLATYWSGRAAERLARARGRLLAGRQTGEKALASLDQGLSAAAAPGALPHLIAGLNGQLAESARTARWEKVATDLAEAETYASRAATATLSLDLDLASDARLVQGRRRRVAVTATCSGRVALENCEVTLVLPDGCSARATKAVKGARLAGPGALLAEFLVQSPFTAEVGGTLVVGARLSFTGPEGAPRLVSTRRALPVLPACAVALAPTEDPYAFNLALRNHADDLLQSYVSVKPPASWALAMPLNDIALQPREERTERLVLTGPPVAPGIYTLSASLRDLARLPLAESTLDVAIVRPDRNRLANAGFEEGNAPPLPAAAGAFWEPYSTGYAVDTAEEHSGARSIACILPPAASGPIAKGKGDSAEFNVVESPTFAGASCEVLLDQSQPKSLFVVGWSKAAGVSGAPGSEYALYVDLRYQDGTPLWGRSAAFSTGTHGWEQKSLIINPEKPVKSLKLYLLFRNRTGKVWFDDVYLGEMGD